MGTQTLKIEGNSRVEVGSLSLGNGTLNIKGSDVIIHKTDKINGTLTAESGYLGLNVATTMADKVKADTTTTTPPRTSSLKSARPSYSVKMPR